MNSPKHTNLADGINFHYFNNIFLTQSHSQARVSFSFFLCVSHSQYFHLWGFDASQSLNVYDLLMLARIFIVAKSNIQYTTTINITVMRFTCYFIFLLLLFHHPELCAIWYSFSFSHSFMTVKVVDTLSHKMFASKIDDYSGLASFAYQFFFSSSSSSSSFDFDPIKRMLLCVHIFWHFIVKYFSVFFFFLLPFRLVHSLVCSFEYHPIHDFLSDSRRSWAFSVWHIFLTPGTYLMFSVFWSH